MAADWHELVVLRRGMQPSTARDSEQLDLRCITTDIPPPQFTRKLLLINRPRRDGTLSWRWYTAAAGGIRTRDLAVASPVPYHTATTAPNVFHVLYGYNIDLVDLSIVTSVLSVSHHYSVIDRRGLVVSAAATFTR